MFFTRFSLFLSVLFFAGCIEEKKLEVVDFVDLNQYVGTWYEIARLPNWFEKDCVGVVANYALKADGSIQVKNSCYLNKLDGEFKESVGVARVSDLTSNAKLQVQFFWPFSGKYWIVDLAKDYSYAVVGTPDRKYLWILSRQKTMDEELYSKILEHLKLKGFDVERLIKTKQV